MELVVYFYYVEPYFSGDPFYAGRVGDETDRFRITGNRKVSVYVAV